MRFILTLWAVLNSSIAISFPEMVRHGYSTCSSCHVSPSGGGVLNAYGRALSGEILSTFGSEQQARYYAPSLPNWINVGGDLRYLNLTSETYKSAYHRHFVMESDFELAISPIPGLTIVGLVGAYNYNFPERQDHRVLSEQRRQYVLIDLSKNVSIRAGRFFPSYGLHLADHTLGPRRGLFFDAGQEKLSSEIFLTSSRGQISLTGIGGDSGSLQSESVSGTSFKKGSGESGLSGRILYNLGSSSQVGASAQRLINKEAKYIRTSYGIHGVLAPLIPQIYTMFEVDQQLVTGQKRDVIWLARQGLEIHRGLHVLSTYEGVRSSYSAWRWSLQLYPVSHLELLGEYQRRVSELGLKTESWVFLMHYYL